MSKTKADAVVFADEEEEKEKRKKNKKHSKRDSSSSSSDSSSASDSESGDSRRHKHRHHKKHKHHKHKHHKKERKGDVDTGKIEEARRLVEAAAVVAQKAKETKITPDEFFSYAAPFRVWLQHVKHKFFDEVPTEESRDLFKDEFVPLWNAGRLPDSVYETTSLSDASFRARTRHKWNFKGVDALELDTVRDGVDTATTFTDLSKDDSLLARLAPRPLQGPSPPPVASPAALRGSPAATGANSVPVAPRRDVSAMFGGDERRDMGHGRPFGGGNPFFARNDRD